MLEQKNWEVLRQEGGVCQHSKNKGKGVKRGVRIIKLRY